MAKEKIIEIHELNIQTQDITIVGDSDLVLNRMNDVTRRKLIDERKDKAKDQSKPNIWEEIITSLHWEHGTPTDFSEEGMREALKTNRPCITAFGLKKSFESSVLDNNISKYSKKFKAQVSITAPNQLVPISFTEHFIDEKLMKPNRSSPVLVRINRFTGWSATFRITFLENVYSLEQIVQIINLAGFGIGIGSGRSTGYGRYHILGK